MDSTVVFGILFAFVYTIDCASPSTQSYIFQNFTFCDETLITPVSNYVTFQNGSIYSTADNILYPPHTYWSKGNETFGCTCLLTNCLNKCCPEGEVINKENECVRSTDSANFDIPSIPIYSVESLPLIEYIEMEPSFKIVFGMPCDRAYRLEPERYEEDMFYPLENGSLYNEGLGIVSIGNYCLEVVVNSTRISAFICFNEDDITGESAYVYTMYPIALAISVPFLAATFLVYRMPELRTLHGRSLSCHVAVLFVGYLFLILIQVKRYDEISEYLCRVSAIVVQFSFLASFFWLNVMCFDLWWTFSGYRSFNGSVKERERKKFIAYSVYAWGFPSLITGVTLLVEFLPGIPKWVIKPDFGQTSCWFNEKKSVLIYFYGPISALLLSNLLMFIHTTVIIVRHKRESKVLKRQGSRKHSTSDTDKQRFFVYLKLFIVMGVNWIMEVVSWLAEGPQYLWYLPDIGNALQGVLIFVIFVCKRRVLRLLNKKLCPGIQIFKDESKATSSRSTSVSSLGSTKRGSKNVGGGRVQMSVFSGGNLPASNTVNGNKGDFMA